ncbi:Piso0_004759 [Millerozyma farinosa CBS 7064]|uniref:Piso0_004759 protein n=1 Tax=Pichia sorbitophila (strain ATCC MYA-4447 / BCRC 22081 / CBS 7064 / NBRC 10061 / NRRL Y-12695) TaxID=559304 RepID=G8Y3A9_PICSO|nr:Piso0_004759 [Millerozyma farinosa CBS 7064]
MITIIRPTIILLSLLHGLIAMPSAINETEAKSLGFSEGMIAAAYNGFTIFNSGAFDESYARSCKGDSKYQGTRCVAYNPEVGKHFIYDMYTGQKVKEIDRSNPGSGHRIENKSSSSGAQSSLAENQCLNSKLGNPNSGICDYSSCALAGSGNCTSEYYDCCTNSLQDYNGRQECSQAICKKTDSLLLNYVDGGCCQG